MEFEPKRNTVLFLTSTAAFTDATEFAVKQNWHRTPRELLVGSSF